MEILFIVIGKLLISLISLFKIFYNLIDDLVVIIYLLVICELFLDIYNLRVWNYVCICIKRNKCSKLRRNKVSLE